MRDKMKRSVQGKWSGRRRSPKTGRLSSAVDGPRPNLSLTKTLLLQKELFHDFVLYLDAGSLTVLCEAMMKVEGTRVVLRDKELWEHLLETHCQVDLTAFKVHRSVVLHGGSSVVNDYLSLRSQFECFTRCIHVLKDDLGTITNVDDQRIECLVFPTSHNYRNPHRGVAGCVHERAGPDLDQALVNTGTLYYSPPGSVKCTVGCLSGTRLLVHCVGPSGGQFKSDEMLYMTYVNALLAADSNHVECAAVASISTGLQNFPVPRAADIALSAVRDLIRLRPHWNMIVAFVCIDQTVFENFQRARQKTFQAFQKAPFAFPHLVKTCSMAEPKTSHET